MIYFHFHCISRPSHDVQVQGFQICRLLPSLFFIHCTKLTNLSMLSWSYLNVSCMFFSIICFLRKHIFYHFLMHLAPRLSIWHLLCEKWQWEIHVNLKPHNLLIEIDKWDFQLQCTIHYILPPLYIDKNYFQTFYQFEPKVICRFIKPLDFLETISQSQQLTNNVINCLLDEVVGWMVGSTKIVS